MVNKIIIASILMTLIICKEKTDIKAGITEVMFNYIFMSYKEKYKLV